MRGLLALLLCALVAQAASAAPLRVAASAGSNWLDADLANYRWDVERRPSFDFELHATRGRLAYGLRLSRAVTSQGLGVPGDSREPDVRMTMLAASARLRLVERAGFALVADGRFGRMHLGYDPDRMQIELPGGGTTEVEFAPIDEWAQGFGLSLERSVLPSVALGLHADYLSFAIDTAHRAGESVEERRERFGNWAARLSVAWTWGER